MPRRPYDLQVVTPERVVLSEPVVSLIAPGVEGKFGVLARHAPLVAELGIGEITIAYEDESREQLAVAGGFLEVSSEGVVVLADAAERADEIDLERAEAAKRRSEERMGDETVEPDIDMTRARSALLRAINRLKIAGRHQP
ncbi:MAG: F0F1 ATP synthase subunit epsilon [Armatimonadota bacterium]|jgi:F-type H+-transporting ATPase subunit epsilon